jgi:hypothetical protein
VPGDARLLSATTALVGRLVDALSSGPPPNRNLPLKNGSGWRNWDAKLGWAPLGEANPKPPPFSGVKSTLDSGFTFTTSYSN